MFEEGIDLFVVLFTFLVGLGGMLVFYFLLGEGIQMGKHIPAKE